MYAALAALGLGLVILKNTPQATVFTHGDVIAHRIWDKRLLDTRQHIADATSSVLPHGDLPATCLRDLVRELDYVRASWLMVGGNINVSSQMRDERDELVALRYLNLAIKDFKETLKDGERSINALTAACPEYPVVSVQGEQLLQTYSELDADLDRIVNRVPTEAKEPPRPAAQ
jgi:hypothetical protein